MSAIARGSLVTLPDNRTARVAGIFRPIAQPGEDHAVVVPLGESGDGFPEWVTAASLSPAAEDAA